MLPPHSSSFLMFFHDFLLAMKFSKNDLNFDLIWFLLPHSFLIVIHSIPSQQWRNSGKNVKNHRPCHESLMLLSPPQITSNQNEVLSRNFAGTRGNMKNQHQRIGKPFQKTQKPRKILAFFLSPLFHIFFMQTKFSIQSSIHFSVLKCSGEEKKSFVSRVTGDVSTSNCCWTLLWCPLMCEWNLFHFFSPHHNRPSFLNIRHDIQGRKLVKKNLRWWRRRERDVKSSHRVSS